MIAVVSSLVHTGVGVRSEWQWASEPRLGITSCRAGIERVPPGIQLAEVALDLFCPRERGGNLVGRSLVERRVGDRIAKGTLLGLERLDAGR